jgi:hypothetical protein
MFGLKEVKLIPPQLNYLKQQDTTTVAFRGAKALWQKAKRRSCTRITPAPFHHH